MKRPKTNKAARRFDNAARKKGSSRVSRGVSSSRGGVLWVTQKRNQDVLATSATGGVGYVFKLSDLASSTDFTLGFDQYCIKSIGYRFYLRQAAAADSNPASAADNGLIYGSVILSHAVDYTDAALPSTLSVVQQLDGCKNEYMQISNLVSRWYNFKPKVAGAVYNNATQNSLSAAGVPKGIQWLATDFPSIEHYGLKIFVQTSFTNAQLGIEFRVTVGLRRVR